MALVIVHSERDPEDVARVDVERERIRLAIELADSVEPAVVVLSVASAIDLVNGLLAACAESVRSRTGAPPAEAHHG